MNEDLKILKTIVKICHNYLQKGEEIDFVINERHLQAIESVLEERKKDKTKLKELERSYLHEKLAKEEVEELLECSISKQKVKDVLDDIYDYFERLNVPDEDIEYIESKRKELLEEGD